MSLYHIISWIVVGLIVGALARFIVPGKDPMGCIATILLGVAGSFVGGFISSLIWHAEKGSYFHPAGIILSLVGAIILLIIWRKLRPAA